jgi:hypothetical protein
LNEAPARLDLQRARGSKQDRAPFPHQECPSRTSIPTTKGSDVILIGIDPHKGSHTAVAIARDETQLGELRLRSSKSQCDRLLDWAAAFPERRFAIESAAGLGRSTRRHRTRTDYRPQPGHPGCDADLELSCWSVMRSVSLKRTLPQNPGTRRTERLARNAGSVPMNKPSTGSWSVPAREFQRVLRSEAAPASVDRSCLRSQRGFAARRRLHHVASSRTLSPSAVDPGNRPISPAGRGRPVPPHRKHVARRCTACRPG